MFYLHFKLSNNNNSDYWQPRSASFLRLVGCIQHGWSCHSAGALIEFLWFLQWIQSYLTGRLEAATHWSTTYSVVSLIVWCWPTSVHPLHICFWSYSWWTWSVFALLCRQHSVLHFGHTTWSSHASAESRLLICMDANASWMVSNCLKINPPLCNVRLAGANISWAVAQNCLALLVFGLPQWFTTLVSFLTPSCRSAIISVSLSGVAFTNCSLPAQLNAGCHEYCHTNMTVRKYDTIKYVLHDCLYWLPVPNHIQCKLCLLVFKAVSGFALPYLSDLCRTTSTVVSQSLFIIINEKVKR